MRITLLMCKMNAIVQQFEHSLALPFFFCGVVYGIVLLLSGINIHTFCVSLLFCGSIVLIAYFTLKHYVIMVLISCSIITQFLLLYVWYNNLGLLRWR